MSEYLYKVNDEYSLQRKEGRVHIVDNKGLEVASFHLKDFPAFLNAFAALIHPGYDTNAVDVEQIKKRNRIIRRKISRARKTP